MLEDSGLKVEDLKNVALIHWEGSARRHFKHLPADEFTSCLIVADETRQDDPLSSDNQIIATLLLVRNVQMSKLGLRESSETVRIALFFGRPFDAYPRHTRKHTNAALRALRPRPKPILTPPLALIDRQAYTELSAACPTLCEILDARTQTSLQQSPALSRMSEFVQSSAMVCVK